MFSTCRLGCCFNEFWRSLLLLRSLSLSLSTSTSHDKPIYFMHVFVHVSPLRPRMPSFHVRVYKFAPMPWSVVGSTFTRCEKCAECIYSHVFNTCEHDFSFRINLTRYDVVCCCCCFCKTADISCSHLFVSNINMMLFPMRHLLSFVERTSPQFVRAIQCTEIRPFSFSDPSFPLLHLCQCY